MSKKVIKILSQIKKVQKMQQSGQLVITGYASTTDTDRAGDIIQADAWNKGGLNSYLKNPILLFNHNYDKPIGKVTQIQTDQMGLKVTASIMKGIPQYNLIQQQIVKTFSVGFMIKDADYNRVTQGFLIKQAELLQISAVSVPCNQQAVFSVAKSFNSDQQYKNYITTNFPNQQEQKNASVASKEEKKMDENQLAEMIAKALADSEAKRQKKAQEKAAAEKAAVQAEKAAKQNQQKNAVAVAKVLQSSTEKLMQQVQKRVKQSQEKGALQLQSLKADLIQKSQQIQKMRQSKRIFQGNVQGKNWKEQNAEEIQKAYILGRVTNKGYNTQFAKNLLEKVNTQSSVQVSSQDFEQQVSTNIQRDIQNQLILAPMFRQVMMNSATTILPIAPDTGYAQMTQNRKPSGAPPEGSLSERGTAHGDFGGKKLRQIELKAYKMFSKSYLANQTQQDAIMPIIPFIRQAMIRSHARGIQNLILLGNHADGVYNGVSNGLVQYADTAGRNLTAAGTDTPLTAAQLFALRKQMGKYGMRPADIVYVVSQSAYYELVQDAQFQDINLVGSMATKITGQVGKLFGSSVVMCDQFPQPQAGKYHALAVNARNFVVPRLRGFSSQSQYLVEEQHRVMVTSQRLGFQQIIPDAKSVIGLKYAA